MASQKDYYEILGVSKTASDDEIKKAYRKLAKQYHPDVSTDPNATEKFKEVQKAYDCLSDQAKRNNYDRFGTEEPNPFGGGSGGDGYGFSGFEDIFSSIFGGGSRRRNPNAPQKGKDILIKMELSFEEAAFGVRKTINLDRFEECHSCHGSGAESHKDIINCSRCRGSGRIIGEQNTLFGRVQTEMVCPECHGKGKKINKACSKCNGAGRLKQKSTLNVDIPAGIDDEQTLRLDNQGEAGLNGGPAGDLYVGISIRKHEFFTRSGFDVIIELPLTFSQAALGAEIEVMTLHGKVKLNIPAGTQNNTKFKLTGKGIKTAASRTGHQFVIVNVITPTNLTKEQKDLFTKLSATDETANNSFFDKVKKFFKSTK